MSKSVGNGKKKITKFCILGERCSGTRYINYLINLNFNLKDYTQIVCHKHFFEHPLYFGRDFQKPDVSKNQRLDFDEIMFLGIVRDPHMWLNSLKKYKYHLNDDFTQNLRNYLNNKPLDMYPDRRHSNMFLKKKPTLKKANKNDNKNNKRNMFVGHNIKSINPETGKMYKNIFQLRDVKARFLKYKMPKIVKNYMFIRYEDLIKDYKVFLNNLVETFDLEDDKSENFGENYTAYTKPRFANKTKFINKVIVPPNRVYNNPKLVRSTEIDLGYISS